MHTASLVEHQKLTLHRWSFQNMSEFVLIIKCDPISTILINHSVDREFCQSLMKERYEKRVREVKEAAGSSGIDDADSTMFQNAGCEQQQTDEQLRADQRRIELLSQLSEDHHERLQVLADVFEKAQKHDLPAEVWH
jgi:hypothetical protein